MSDTPHSAHPGAGAASALPMHRTAESPAHDAERGAGPAHAGEHAPSRGTPSAAAGGAVAWVDPARRAAFDDWMRRIASAQGLVPGSERPASADASFRRYLRVDREPPAGGAEPSARTRIVMDAPPALEDNAAFVKIAALMRAAGVRVPRVLDWDEPHGFLLLDDLGSATLLPQLDPNRPDDARRLLEPALDALVRWQSASLPGVLPPYDEVLLRRELQLFPDWYLAKHRGAALGGEDRRTLDGAFDAIVRQNLTSPAVYVHRDFMPRNLMPHAEDGVAVLDFQDAVHGPVTYDIASLMRDAFLSWDEDVVLDITVRYWQRAQKAGLPVPEDFGDFYRAVEWMGLQRHLKVAGIFARLTLRDGKPKYLADTPRFIAYIRHTAGRYRELTPLLRLVDRIEGIENAQGFAYGRV